MLARLQKPSRRSISLRNSRFTSRSSRRTDSMSPRELLDFLAILVGQDQVLGRHSASRGRRASSAPPAAARSAPAPCCGSAPPHRGAVRRPARRASRLMPRPRSEMRASDAGEVLQGAQHERAVVGVGDRHLLAQELAHLDPELIVEGDRNRRPRRALILQGRHLLGRAGGRLLERPISCRRGLGGGGPGLVLGPSSALVSGAGGHPGTRSWRRRKSGPPAADLAARL